MKIVALCMGMRQHGERARVPGPVYNAASREYFRLSEGNAAQPETHELAQRGKCRHVGRLA